MNTRTNSILAAVRARMEDREDSVVEAADLSRDEAFAKAKAAFLKATGLPKEAVEPGEHAIAIPKLFKSLWTDLKIVTRTSQYKDSDQLDISWRYSHPGGGSNGYSVGTIGVSDTLAGYRLDGNEFVKVWTA